MMAVATQAGAFPHNKIDWRTINWRKVNHNVRRLQVRIVKAMKENRWGRVKALQHLLTHSFSGKALAVRRVTENSGRKTSGVDGIIWDTPEKKATAITNLRQRGYKPLPLLRIYIPKSDGKKTRPLSIPTKRDMAMQALYLLALDPIAETEADRNTYGFRKQRTTADAIEQCFLILSKSKGAAEWIMEGDIRSCFDKISHGWLETNIPMDKVILRKWLKAGYIDQHVFNKTEEGTPQGGIISPVIARMTLNGLERLLCEKFSKNTNKHKKDKVNAVVFADDFIITGRSKELLENEISPLVKIFLQERGLELSLEKTKITHIKDGFDFLGQNIRKYKGKILIKPAKKNIKSFLTKIRRDIKDNKQITASKLILKLNPIIKGWANYHKHVVSKKTFRKVDAAIFFGLWRWAKRRHPKKSLQWVKGKYFHHIEGQNWVFSTSLKSENGKPTTLQLFRMVSVPIKRHIKIRGEANPYDPEWEIYFEDRLGLQMLDTLKEKRRLLKLWFSQDGICPICSQKISKDSGWNIHHIVWQTNGGKDTMSNLVLLHPTCHNQVHSLKLEVSKPRPLTRAF